MSASAGRRPAPKPISEIRDVYDFLDNVRLRPGMYVPQSSVTHLHSMLHGFDVAMQVSGNPGATPFGTDGPFAEWLRDHVGSDYGSLTWGRAIELTAEDRSVSAIDLFFGLLDKFRAETAR